MLAIGLYADHTLGHNETIDFLAQEKYRDLLTAYQDWEPIDMVGSSLRSDILPVLAVGGQAAHVPYAITWKHESARQPAPGTPGLHPLSSSSEVPALAALLQNRR